MKTESGGVVSPLSVSKRRLRALTLLETVMFLAIFAVVIVGILSVYRTVATNNEIQMAQNRITAMAGAARRFYASTTPPGSLVNFAAQRDETLRLLRAGVFRENDLALRLGNNAAPIVVPTGTNGLTRPLPMNVLVYYDSLIDRVVVRILGMRTAHCLNFFGEGLRSSGLFETAHVEASPPLAQAVLVPNGPPNVSDVRNLSVVDVNSLCAAGVTGKSLFGDQRLNTVVLHVLP